MRWDLAEVIEARFVEPDATLHELFGRVVFNMCISNTNDHPRNHAAFWDAPPSTHLESPLDRSPQLRSGDTATQATAITVRVARTT